MKNIIIAVLALVVLGETGYIGYTKVKNEVKPMIKEEISEKLPVVAMPTASPSGRIPYLTKGDKFADSPMFKFAYKLAPGPVPAETTKMLTGFSVASKTQSNGSVVVTLTPRDSDDQFQQYTVLPGQTLYFIEQTPADDQPDTDKDLNLRDDFGVLVDSNGLVL